MLRACYARLRVSSRTFPPDFRVLPVRGPGASDALTAPSGGPRPLQQLCHDLDIAVCGFAERPTRSAANASTTDILGPGPYPAELGEPSGEPSADCIEPHGTTKAFDFYLFTRYLATVSHIGRR
jgi:hypothetical protein